MRVLSTSVHGLEIPVGECPCIARGAYPFLCPWSAWCFVYCTSAHTCTTNLYYSTTVGRYIKNDDHHHHHEPRTKFHLIEKMSRREKNDSTILGQKWPVVRCLPRVFPLSFFLIQNDKATQEYL